MDQTVSKKYGKEMIGYEDHRDNYVADRELTVTITLAEYRQLVKTAAKRDADIAERNLAINAKDAEICNLKSKIEQLLNKLGEQND